MATRQRRWGADPSETWRPAGATYIPDAGVLIDPDALASETAVPHRRRPAVPRSTLVTARRHLSISFVRHISPGSAPILAAKAAEIAPCRDFNEEVLIFSPL